MVNKWHLRLMAVEEEGGQRCARSERQTLTGHLPSSERRHVYCLVCDLLKAWEETAVCTVCVRMRVCVCVRACWSDSCLCSQQRSSPQKSRKLSGNWANCMEWLMLLETTVPLKLTHTHTSCLRCFRCAVLHRHIFFIKACSSLTCKTGVKHRVQVPEQVLQRLQSGPRDGSGKSEGGHKNLRSF